MEKQRQEAPPIEIKNKEQFREAARFAKTLGKNSRGTFIRCLKTINRIRRNNAYQTFIWPDFVKHSFNFAFYSNGQLTMNGGMILHGFEETFSVELVGESFPHWSIHT